MSSFKKRLEDSHALSVLSEVFDGDKRFICYTSFSDSESLWEIAITDGFDVWKLSLTEEQLNDLAGTEVEDSFIRDVSHCLGAGDVQLLHTVSHLTVCLRSSNQPLELHMHELSTSQCRQQLQGLVFDLWTHLDTTRSKLKECNKQLEEAKQKHTQQQVLVDVAQHSAKQAAATRAKRPAGASLVNPSLKRRKAVKGVVFGEDPD